MYLKKGYAEEAAQRELAGLAYGDGAGNSRTRYYYEINSYDGDKVYYTAWVG
jgi:hypothetical protein